MKKLLHLLPKNLLGRGGEVPDLSGVYMDSNAPEFGHLAIFELHEILILTQKSVQVNVTLSSVTN